MRGHRKLTLQIGLLGWLVIAARSAEAVPSQPPLIPEGETFADAGALIATISRASPVHSAAMSPDGTMVAAASEDAVVHVWDRITGREILRLEGHDGAVRSVTFSTDGQTLGSASDDGTLRLWELDSGREIRRFDGHTGEVLSVAFSADGQILASGSTDGTVRLWDRGTGREIRRLEGDGAAVLAVTFSTHGQILASASEDGIIRVWELDSDKELLRLDGHGRPCRDVAFSPDGRNIASALDDGTVGLWDVLGNELRLLEGHEAGVYSVAFSPEGRTLASASGDGTVRLWDVDFGDEVRRFEGHASDVLSVAFSRDGKVLVSASADTTVRLWDVTTREELRRFEGHASAVHSVAFRADGRELAAASDDGMVRLWDLAAGREQQRFESHEPGAFSTIFSPNGRILAFTGNDLAVRLLDLETGEQRRLAGHESWVLALAFSPDGRTLASSSEDGTVHLLDITTGQVLRRLEGGGLGSPALAFSPDGKLLASPSGYGVRVWNVTIGARILTLPGHESWIFSLAFSPDGRILASGSDDESVRLWRLETGRETYRLEGAGKVFSVAFSPDGEILAAGSEDGSVSLWDAETGREIRRLAGHSSKVFSLTFSPDSRTLASGSGDGTVRIWDLPAAHTSARSSQIFLGGRRGCWIVCRIGDSCYRHDDGTLLVRRSDRGLEPIPVPAEAATIELVEAPDEIRTLDGRIAPLSVKVRNRGPQAAYWLRVRRSGSPTADPFTLKLPPCRRSLEAGEVTEFELGISTHAAYEDPQGTTASLGLEIVGLNSEPLPVPAITVHGKVPSLEWGRAAWFDSGDNLVLSVELTNRGGQAAFAPQLAAQLPGRSEIFPIVSHQDDVLPGETLRATLVAPEGFDSESIRLVDLVVRTRKHSAHVWRFRNQPLLRSWPIFRTSMILLAMLAVLAAAFLGTWFHPLARKLSDDPAAIRRLHPSKLRTARRLLRTTRRLISTLDAAGIERAWLDGAVTFLSTTDLAARNRCLCNRLGTPPHPHPDAADFHVLPLGVDFPLNLEECLVHQPPAERPVAEVLSQLRARPETRSQVTLLVGSSGTQQENLHRLAASDQTSLFVAPSCLELTELLLTPEPIPVLARLIASQVKLTRISPYQTGRGVDKESIFFGRSELLAHILHREPANYLVVGGRQIGKSSLLKAIERRYRDHPEINCYYVVLFDSDLVGPLARAVGLPRDTPPGDLFAYLDNGRRRFFLIDEADAFIRAERRNNHVLLSRLRSLSEQGRDHFILAGFWDLYIAAVHDYHSPLKNFGEIQVVGALEPDACRELATVPMEMMGLRYAPEGLVDRMIHETGRRANLISLACNELVEQHQLGRREVGADSVKAVLASRRIEEALGGWNRLSDDETSNRLDRILVWATISRDSFTQPEALRTLEGVGGRASPEEVSRSLERLELAFVLKRDETRYTYRVPLFQRMLLKQDPSFQLARELELFRSGQPLPEGA